MRIYCHDALVDIVSWCVKGAVGSCLLMFLVLRVAAADEELAKANKNTLVLHIN